MYIKEKIYRNKYVLLESYKKRGSVKGERKMTVIKTQKKAAHITLILNKNNYNKNYKEEDYVEAEKKSTSVMTKKEIRMKKVMNEIFHKNLINFYFIFFFWVNL